MKTSDRVYVTLHREILDGDLPPGTLLAEIEQSNRLGVSRTPLREALGRLAADGLVAAGTGRGLVVTEVSLDRVRELFEMREALEVQAARLAARRRDPDVFERLRSEFSRSDELLGTADPSKREFFDLTRRLDEAIDTAAGNAYLVNALRGVRAHVAQVRTLSRDKPERLQAATQEHLMIIEAIIEGSERLAAAATELHLHRSLASILDTISFTGPSRGRDVA